MSQIRSVLLIGEATGAEAERLEQRFPGMLFHVLRTDEDLAAVAERVRPDAVYSINGAPFAPALHTATASYPSVRWIHVGGSGYDHVLPIPPGRVLTHSPGLLAEPHAVTVIGVIIALNGHMPRYLDQQARRVWKPHHYRPIRGQTLLVVGLGRVGVATARLARQLGMRVIGVKRLPMPHPDADYVIAFDRLHDGLREADVVSVHLRSTADTRHVFDRAAFRAMRRGSIFVNTARGAVAEEIALAEALSSCHLASAHLDVFETEPLSPESPLWGLPNLLITPHAADNIANWPNLFADAFAENLRRWQAGEVLLNRVETEPSEERR